MYIQPFGLELVTDLSEKTFAPCNIFNSFHAFGRKAIYHAKDAASLFRLRDQHFGRIRGGTENTSHFWQGFNRVQNVNGKISFGQK